VKRHKHAKLLETVVYHIHVSKDTIQGNLYKVKAHAGILGNESADAIAKCSAENQCGHDFHSNTDTPPIHPYSGKYGWETLPQLAYPILLTPVNEGLRGWSPAERLSIFSDLDAVKGKSTHACPTQTRS
jgi:hypothetical protein